MSFWNNLPKPIIVLAPMADVTDAPFRRMIAKYSAHTRKDGSVGDVMWTEFVSGDGLMRATPEGKAKLMADLMYTGEERPIVAQLFSSHPEYMEQAARLVAELGFDGIDINMGCPDKGIEKQGCGSAMIRNPERAKEIVRAVKRGAPNIPVTVKTRLGYNTDILEEWLPELLSVEPAVITVHARTRKEMSKVPARWERVKRAVEIRNEVQNAEWERNNPGKYKTLIFGNGDVRSLADAEVKAHETGADGIMVGRAIFGNPWFFHPAKRLPERVALSGSISATHYTEWYSPNASHGEHQEPGIEMITVPERLRVLVEHTKLFEELLPFKNFAIMKKHYKAYVNGFDGAKELRVELMEQQNSTDIERVVNEWLKKNMK
jgi:tRNA-dihydrouridine synthase